MSCQEELGPRTAAGGKRAECVMSFLIPLSRRVGRENLHKVHLVIVYRGFIGQGGGRWVGVGGRGSEIKRPDFWNWETGLDDSRVLYRRSRVGEEKVMFFMQMS
jgi:hypothetical protein